MKEIREILGDLDYELLSMKEAGVDIQILNCHILRWMFFAWNQIPAL